MRTARAAAVFYLQCLQILKQHFSVETITLTFCTLSVSHPLVCLLSLRILSFFLSIENPGAPKVTCIADTAKNPPTREERSGCRTGQVQELMPSQEGMLGKRRLCGAGEEVRWVKCEVMSPELRAAAVMCPTQHVDEKTHTLQASSREWQMTKWLTWLQGAREGGFNALKQKSHNPRNAAKDRASWKTLVC